MSPGKSNYMDMVRSQKFSQIPMAILSLVLGSSLALGYAPVALQGRGLNRYLLNSDYRYYFDYFIRHGEQIYVNWTMVHLNNI